MKQIKNIVLSFTIMSCLSICCVMATVKKKTLTTSYSTTSIQATAKYYTDETTRWSVGNPEILSTGGKGGGASKSGSATTSQSGNEYTVKQKYTISATDNNYITTSATKTFQWCVNGTSNTYVSSKCLVK